MGDRGNGRPRSWVNPPTVQEHARVLIYLRVLFFLRVFISETLVCSVPSALCLQKYGRVEC